MSRTLCVWLSAAVLAVCLLPAASPARAETPESPAAVAETPDSAAAMTAEELVAMADEVAAEVEELRGWPFKTPVPKNVRSEEELKAYMVESFEKDYPGDMPDRLGASLAMVGLLPPGMDLMDMMLNVLMNQVGGFYDPPTKAFYMVNRDGMEMPPAVMKMMVAHELTHALDDQYVGLDDLIRAYERSEDGEFALGSVVEGSATILMTRYLTGLQLSGQLTMQDLTDLMESEVERSKPMLEAPSYFQTIIGRYTLGMLFLLQNNMGLLMSPEAGKIVGERFLAAAADPPRSSEQILHPDKYWDEAARDLPVTVDDEEVEKLLGGLGLGVAHRETFGEILIAMVVRPVGTTFDMMNASNPAAWTDSASMGWGGDRFYLLGPAGGSAGEDGGIPLPPADDRRGLWITAWDTPTDLGEFTAAYLTAHPDDGGVLLPLGARATAILFGMDADERAALAQALSDSPPEFEQGKKKWAP